MCAPPPPTAQSQSHISLSIQHHDRALAAANIVDKQTTRNTVIKILQSHCIGFCGDLAHIVLTKNFMVFGCVWRALEPMHVCFGHNFFFLAVPNPHICRWHFNSRETRKKIRSVYVVQLYLYWAHDKTPTCCLLLNKLMDLQWQMNSVLTFEKILFKAWIRLEDMDDW